MTAEERALRYNELDKLLRSEGWAVLNEVLTENITSDTLSLSSVGARSYPDDFLRGRLAVMRWFQVGLPADIRTYFEEETRKSMAQADAGQPPEGLGHPYAEDNPPEIEG